MKKFLMSTTFSAYKFINEQFFTKKHSCTSLHHIPPVLQRNKALLFYSYLYKRSMIFFLNNISVLLYLLIWKENDRNYITSFYVAKITLSLLSSDSLSVATHTFVSVNVFHKLRYIKQQRHWASSSGYKKLFICKLCLRQHFLRPKTIQTTKIIIMMQTYKRKKTSIYNTYDQKIT